MTDNIPDKDCDDQIACIWTGGGWKPDVTSVLCLLIISGLLKKKTKMVNVNNN